MGRVKQHLRHLMAAAVAVGTVFPLSVAYLAPFGSLVFAQGVGSYGSYPLTYSGRLTSETGAPLTGTADIAATFWDSESAGTQRGEAFTFKGTSLTEGVFVINFPFTGDQVDTIFGDGTAPVFVEIVAEGKNYPRQKFNYVPLAMRVPIDKKSLAFDGQSGLLRIKGTDTSASGSVLVSDGAGGVKWDNLSAVNLVAKTVTNTDPTPNQVLTYQNGKWVAATPAATPVSTAPTGNYLTGLTGDITANGPGAGTATLAAVAIPGTAAKVTFDAKGRVLSGTTLNANDVTTALGFTPVSAVNITAGSGLSGGNITNAGTISLANTAVTAGTYTRANIIVDPQGRITNAENAPAIGDSDISATANIAQSKIAGLSTSFSGKQDFITAGISNQYFRGDKTWQTLNTASVPESGTNLYYTDSRARTSITGTAPIAFSNTTGIISISKGDDSTNGYLSSTDWTTFNAKQNALGFVPLNKAGDTMSGALNMSAQSITGLAAPTAADDAATKSYVDTAAYLMMKKDGSTPLTGTWAVGQDLTNVGNLALAQSKTLGLGVFDNATEGTMTAGLNNSGATSPDKGKTWFNKDSNQIKYWDGTSANVIGVAGAGLTSLNGLTTNSQTFSTGTAGSSPNVVSNGSTHTLNTPLASAASVTAGLISNTDYALFNSKVSSVNQGTGISVATASGTATVSLATTGTAGSYAKVTTDTYGRVTAGTSLTANDLPPHSAALITSGTVGVANGGTGSTSLTANNVLLGNGTNALQTVAPGTSGNVLTSNGTTWQSTTLPWSTPGTIGSATPSTGAFTSITSASQAGYEAKPYGVAAGDTGEVHFDELAANGTNYVGFKAPDALAANNVWVLPATDGAAGQVLKTDGAGKLDWVSAATGSVTNVTATAPISVTNGNTTPAISISQANGTTNGFLGSTDWTAFTNKLSNSGDTMTGNLTLPLNGLAVGATQLVTASGNVGIGIAAPASPLHLYKTTDDVSIREIARFTAYNAGDTSTRIMGGSSNSNTSLRQSVIDSYRGDSNLVPILFTQSNGSSTNERMRIAATGNVGVGTTSPGQKLSVAGVVESTSGGFKFPDGTTQTTASAGGASQWTTSGTAVNYSSGNVGIGSATPAKLLDVAGLYQVDGSSGTATHNFPDMSGGALIAKYAGTQVFNATYATMTIGPWQAGAGYTIQTNSNAAALNLNVTTAAPLTFSTSNTERIRILSTGNVGVGTNNPAKLLSLESSSTSDTSIRLKNTSIGGGDWMLGSYGSANGGGAGKFAIWDAAASANRLVIAGDGNVGIGTTAPTAALQTVANITGSLPATSGTTQTGAEYRMSSSGGATLDFGTQSNGVQWIQATNLGNLALNYSLLLNPNGGSVGIGTTAPADLMHIYSSGTTANLGYVAGNGTRQWRAGVRGDTSSAYAIQDDTANAMRLVINSSGNVGIGTASPSEMLEVAGKIKSTSGGIVFPDGTIQSTSATSGANNSMISGWPDVLKCNVTNPGWGVVAVYPTHMPWSSDGVYRYRINIENGVTYEIRYNSNGTFSGYANLTTTDCADTITNLYAAGKAFNFAKGPAGQWLQSGNSAYYNAGNVGIGTSIPSALFDVRGRMIGDVDNIGLAGLASNALVVARNTPGDGMRYTQHNVGSIWLGHSTLGIIGTDSKDLTFKTGMGVDTSTGTERMRITTSGNVGIGTTTPTANLDVDNSANASTAAVSINAAAGQNTQLLLKRGGSTVSGFTNVSSDNSLRINNNGADRITVNSAGNVGIGMTSPGTALDVNGPLRAQDNGTFPSTGAGMEMTYRSGTGYLQAYNRSVSSWLPMQINGSTVSVTNMSDERVKSNIEDLRTEYGLSGILKLRPVNYTWRDSERDRSQGLQVGLIAQDVQRVFPKLVTQFGTDDTITYADGSTETVNKVLGLNYNGLIVPLVKSVQEIKAEKDAEIAALKAESESKDAAIRKLQVESAQLRAFLCSQFPDAQICR